MPLRTPLAGQLKKKLTILGILLKNCLQNSEFEYIFGMSRMDFYRLPEWRRNELKKRAKLF